MIFDAINVRTNLLLSIGIATIAILMNQHGYGQGPILSNSYVNSNCGLSIQYPSNWKFEEQTSDLPVKTINWIVEFQPDTSEGFNSVVGIELDELSWPIEKSIEGIKDFEEEYIRSGGIGYIESSETTSIAGYPAQKIIYTEQGDDFTFKKIEVDILAYDREYKVTYDTSGEESLIRNFPFLKK